jgi:hypothetical protein
MSKTYTHDEYLATKPTQELVDRLVAERDSLAAQVTQLWRAAVTAHNAHSDFYEGQKFVCNTIMSTPKQCLAERDAEVAKAAYKAAAYVFTQPWPNRDWTIDFSANEYANQLRQAAKDGE